MCVGVYHVTMCRMLVHERMDGGWRMGGWSLDSSSGRPQPMSQAGAPNVRLAPTPCCFSTRRVTAPITIPSRPSFTLFLLALVLPASLHAHVCVIARKHGGGGIALLPSLVAIYPSLSWHPPTHQRVQAQENK